MKKVLLIMSMLLVLYIATACGVSSDDYNSVSAELDTANTERETLKNDLKNVRTQNEDLKKDLKNAQTENEELKAKITEYEKIIEPYKNLTAAEIEAQAKEANLKAEKDKKELEAIKKKEAEEKAAKEKKEAATKEKAEKAGYNTGITYKQLARTPDDYKDKKVKFSGKVLQVVEGDDYVHLRFAVDSDYDNVLYVEYDKSIVTSRILEDDYITIYGTSFGLYSYESTMGGTITIPSVLVDKIDQ